MKQIYNPETNTPPHIRKNSQYQNSFSFNEKRLGLMKKGLTVSYWRTDLTGILNMTNLDRQIYLSAAYLKPYKPNFAFINLGFLNAGIHYEKFL